MLNTMFHTLEDRLNITTKIRDIAVCGHRVTDENIFRAGKERFGVSSKFKIFRTLVLALFDCWKNRSSLKRISRSRDEINIEENFYTDPVKLLHRISDAFPRFRETASVHTTASRVSVFSEVIALSQLAKNCEEITTEHLVDIAVILGSNTQDVVSAEIPEAIKKLTQTIRRNSHWETFCSLPPKEALNWIRSSCPEVKPLFETFLNEHGHRVLRELDFKTVTYDMNPEALIISLQNLVRQSSDTHQEIVKPAPVSPKEIVKRLKTLKDDNTRRFISFILPWMWTSVARREATKAVLISIVHKYRKAFCRLGDLCVREGYLPEKDLIFYLTFWELHRLLETRNPNLITKATIRKRNWTQWDRLSFPEIMFGVPKPISAEDGEKLSEKLGATIQGTPVTENSITARACVVMELEGDQGISQLQQGDIIITYSTDVGWSPYFPVAGGVVTELGGLVSHGAVVAREYGLPCLVGAGGATKVFKTGDIVRLCGKTGVITKVIKEDIDQTT